MELRVGRKFRLGRKLGSGAFGDCYLGTNILSGENAAIKLEPLESKHRQLLYEAKIYKLLEGGVGIPRIHWFGLEGDYSVMIIDLLGPSLEDLFNSCYRRFSLKTVCMLAEQLLTRLEFIHERNFIHRDVKPDNFLIGLGKYSKRVYVVDFGLAKRFRNPKTHIHMAYKENKRLTGTPRYASINNHLGIEQSRRDDLESLGYVLVYFLKGFLPWQGIRAATKKQKYQKIMQKKMATPIESLCRNLPSEFNVFFDYCRALRFDDRPDYDYLRELFRNVFRANSFRPDGRFDWEGYGVVVKRSSDLMYGPMPDTYVRHAHERDERLYYDGDAPAAPTAPGGSASAAGAGAGAGVPAGAAMMQQPTPNVTAAAHGYGYGFAQAPAAEGGASGPAAGGMAVEDESGR